MRTRLAARRLLFAFAAFALASPACRSRRPPPEPSPSAPADRMAWWREARFGMFVHWGLYAIPAGEWKGSGGHAEWIRDSAHIPVEEYETLLPRFNPVKFDADRWARTAKAAGMRYLVITSKHHDGFCLFDSKQTDWDVASTPFGRDILRELSDACRRHGIRFCTYHSIMDWHHPDYLPRRGWEKRPTEGADFGRFERYLHSQVREIVERYRPAVLWFDGEWESTWTHEHGKRLFDLCRSLDPGMIVNNRVDKGRAGMAGMTIGEEFLGDFGTPEQEIPASGLPGVDWETCMTLNDHWGFNARDDNWKSADDLIRKLADIASKGGNFLLNVGPTAEGEIPAPSVERLAAIGQWLERNGEAIYGTEAGPLGALPWGRCTMKREGSRTRLFLLVFDWPADRRLEIAGLGNDPHGARLLTAPGHALAVTRERGTVRITLPAEAPDLACSVVTLELEGPPIVYQPPTIEAAAPIFVRPLEVRIATSRADLEVRYTLDGSEPTATSPLCEGPISLSETTTVKALGFRAGEPVTPVARAGFRRVEPHAAATVEGTQPGVIRERFAGSFDKLPDFSRLQPTASDVVPTIALPSGPREEFVAYRFRGFLAISRDDVYAFSLNSDDGARLLVSGEVVVDNDGLHAALAKTGSAALAAGLHPFEVVWFNKTGDVTLDLTFAPAGETLAPIPESGLFRRR